MRLDQALVARKLCESRTEAQELISKGFVQLNSVLCTKQTRQVSVVDILTLNARRSFVSRGGEKLEGILLDVFSAKESIQKFCSSKTALDIGSSTGGFTDCLLQYGVSQVDAVDVGTLQLHEKLRNDSRVSLFENTDIRNFEKKQDYDIIVADLSFITLDAVLEDILRFSGKETCLFLLIKPQFEVGKGNTKKGIVKDMDLVNSVLNHYKKELVTRGLEQVTIFPCRIQGGDGNQEYFIYTKSA